MSKRAPYAFGEDLSGKKYWKSLNEFEATPEFQAAAAREFPDGASELDPVSRRSFMKLMGASAGLAGVVACRRPEEKIVPYSRAPEHLIPGNAEYYATAFAFNGSALGLLVESHEGRPTKVEGNPNHPDSLGASNQYAQALALEIYDTDRSRNPSQGTTKKSWADVSVALPKLGEAAKANGGAKLAILTEAHRSPTLAALLGEVKAAFPQSRVYRYDPFSRDNVRAGAKAALGKDVEPLLNLKGAKVILTLDADILNSEAGSIRNARAFAEGRRLAKPGDAMNRLYSVESAYSITGANADHRLRVQSRDVTEFAYALAQELATAHGVNLGDAAGAVAAFKGDKFNAKKPWVKSVARDLAQNKGASLITAGRGQPAAVHALVAALNAGLENAGKTVSYVAAFDAAADGPSALASLTDSLNKGEVDTLIIVGGNPVFDGPASVNFGAALKKAPNSVHLSFEFNETSEAAAWHLNRAHDLESWSDVRSLDGTLSVVQPLIAPIFDGKTAAEVLSHLLGTPRKAHDLVKATWQKTLTGDIEKAWRRALHDGVVPGSAFAAEAGTVNLADVQKLVAATPPQKADGMEVTFHPDSHAWDGRFANNGWLQELPDPMSKLTWDNGAVLSFQTAKKLGVQDGEYVSVKLGATELKLPAIVVPGQADDSVAIAVGQGRTKVGVVGEGVGFNTFALRTAENPWFAQGATVQKAGGRHEIARTQEHHSMEGRPLVRETSLGKFNEDPEFARKMVKHPPLLSLFPDREYLGHKWGMVIDLNACIGCGACMVSCQAENNIPLVGKWGVSTSREMHWIRIDRYFAGAQDDPREDPEVVFQPVPCQQCELAPCEQVCPVAATTHSPEGLNDMAYNRCVGTRYCANNCPYKVRRFNFHNYAKDFSSIKAQMKVGQFFKKDYQDLRRMQFNPDVTVRTRGVMEKCTYCVQRINVAKIELKREGRTDMKDGEVVSACQQTCPTGAIHFGDLNLQGSDVAQNAANPRNYAILGEINTRPRTTYLAKVRNPNRELEA